MNSILHSRSQAIASLLWKSSRAGRQCRLSTAAADIDITNTSDNCEGSPPASASLSSICHGCPTPNANKVSPNNGCPNNNSDSYCSTLLHIDKQHVLHPYTSMTNPLPTFPVQSAKGVHITLTNGQKLIDGMSSWWAAVHGYRNPILDAAMTTQINDCMSHVMFGGLTHRPAVELAGRLLQMVNNDYHHPSSESSSSTSSTNEFNDSHSFSDFDLERMQHEYKLTKVFFSDSGSISVEVAMKMAIQYWYTVQQQEQSQTSITSTKLTCAKTKFISLRNGYHGDTFGAMSVCDPVNGMHTMFANTLSKQLFVTSPTGPTVEDANQTLAEMAQMLEQHHNEVAAIIVEPIVQGAGGMKFYHPIVLQKVRKLCDEYNVLLIFDEIATGFGRTGTLFAGWQNDGTYRPWSSLHRQDNQIENEGSTVDNISTSNSSKHEEEEEHTITYPDILCLGKALTGGYMTMGATLTNDRLAHGISDTGGVFMHGPTFMANPLACSVSLASINLLMQSPWKERVHNVERALIQHLSPLAKLSSVVKEVRVLGAIGVCELHEGLDRDGMAKVQRQLVEEGVWLRPFGKLLYTMPPFNCEELEEEHVKRIGDAMYSVASTL